MNTATDSADFEKSIRIPYQQDGFDDVRAEYSQMLRQQLSKGNNGLTKTKFLTYGIEGDSMAQVKPRLEHIQNDLMNNFHRLGVLAKPLDGTERLRLMHGMLNMDGANKFHFNWKDLVPSGLSVKDAIAPTALAFKNSRTFQMGGIFGAVSFLNITASDLSDQLLKDFLDMDSSQIVTMHIQSVDQNKAIKTIKHTITELDRSKIEEQKKAVRAGYDMDVLPSDLATYGRDAKALLKELQSQNERISEKNLPPDGRNAISAARNWYLFELSDDDRKEALLIAQTNLADSEKKLKEIEEQNQKAERNCSDLFTWASTYKGASFERRQAILKQFIKEVRVGRDYNIEIVLNVPLDEFEEFKRHAASAGRGKNQKNKSQNPQKVGRCTSNAGIVVLDKTAGETISIVPKNAAHAILRC